MRLAEAEKMALELLGAIPEKDELCIKVVEDRRVWLGIGYLVGRGLAVYLGDDCYRLNAAGRLRLAEEE